MQRIERRMAENSKLVQIGTYSNGEPIYFGGTWTGLQDASELEFLHSTFSESSLEYWRAQSTEDIIRSLSPEANSPLIVKPNGIIMQGNHRIQVLMERGVDVNKLPRVPR